MWRTKGRVLIKRIGMALGFARIHQINPEPDLKASKQSSRVDISTEVIEFEKEQDETSSQREKLSRCSRITSPRSSCQMCGKPFNKRNEKSYVSVEALRDIPSSSRCADQNRVVPNSSRKECTTDKSGKKPPLAPEKTWLTAKCFRRMLDDDGAVVWQEIGEMQFCLESREWVKFAMSDQMRTMLNDLVDLKTHFPKFLSAMEEKLTTLKEKMNDLTMKIKEHDSRIKL